MVQERALGGACNAGARCATPRQIRHRLPGRAHVLFVRIRGLRTERPFGLGGRSGASLQAASPVRQWRLTADCRSAPVLGALACEFRAVALVPGAPVYGTPCLVSGG